jgi:signal transduction histidine kinase
MLFFLYRYRLKTNKELEALNMTKDRLFATLAHDLKNPLSAFRSITQSLSENLFNLDKEEVLYFLSKLNKSSHQLNDLLQNLLHWAISQIDQLNIRNQPLVLKEMMESIIELLRLNAEERNISIEVSCPEQLIVYSDSEIIKTILRNLISNAIKFSKRSGQILVSAKENEDWIELAVRDHGIGIAEENIPLLFDTSTNQARIGNSENKGTGLGLFLCNDLGKRLGAKLEVESQLAKGSCFKLKIPKP